MIIVKGSECVLRMKGDEGDLDEVGMTFPAGYVVAHDPTGEWLRPCDFYIAKFKRSLVNVDDAYEDGETRLLAERYFGDRSRMSDGSLELPDGRWHRVGLITEIGYRRRGDRKGLYQHNYDRAVPLYECRGRSKAWRLRLPNGCVADERGFVWP